MESKGKYMFGKGTILKLLLLFFVSFSAWTSGLMGQAVVNSILPAGTIQRGQWINIVGTRVYDWNNNNCDSLIFIKQPSGPSYRFRSTNQNTVFDYTGFDGGNGFFIDTIHFRIPCTFADGNYDVYAYDDENCDNFLTCGPNPLQTVCGYSPVQTITISGTSSVVTYPGNGIYCLGETNPGPSTFGTGTFLDLTSTTFPNSTLLNTGNGNIVLQSGWVGIPHIIQYTSAFCIGRDTVRLKNMASPTINYLATSYCKSLDTIPKPVRSLNKLGGTFSSSPNLPGLDPDSGFVDLTVAGTFPGNYLITYTMHPDSCGNAATDFFEIIDFDSALFDYDPVQCIGNVQDGFPATITSLPSSGGWFQLINFPLSGITIDSTTGQIDLGSSATPGTYEIGYMRANLACFQITSDFLTVRKPDSASYSVPSPVCNTTSSVSCVLTTPVAGIFSCPSLDVVFSDVTLGTINIAGSNTGGPFRIVRTNGDLTCPDTVQHYITIQQPSGAVLNYVPAKFCKNDNNPLPLFISGSAGGRFSIDPGGVIDSITGEIILDSTAVGIYNVYYQVGGAFCNTTITIPGIEVDFVPVADFNLSATAICDSSGLELIDSLPTSGGIDTITIATMAGVVFVGAITPPNISTAMLDPGGPYRITRTSTLNGCRDSYEDFVVVNAAEHANFKFDPDSLCKSDQNPFPIFLGNGGGLFFNLPNTLLSIDDSTGLIDLDFSADGTHTIVHYTTGNCPDTSAFNVTILDAFNPYFYYRANEFCQGSSDTLTALGITIPQTEYEFSVSPALPALDLQSGFLDFGAFPPAAGDYAITMTLTNSTGACVIDFQQTIRIDSADGGQGTLTFGPGIDSIFCSSELIAQSILIPDSLYQMGRFFSSPATLAWLDRDTGSISLAATPARTYDIFFVLSNVCNDTIRYPQLKVETPAFVTMQYTDGDTITDEFCRSGLVNASPILNPPSTGYFYSAPVDPFDTLVFETDSTTGIIDLSQTEPGFYSIYFVDTSGCTGSVSADIRILSGPTNIALTITPNDTICAGTETTLRGSGGDRYYMNFGLAVDTAKIVVTSGLLDGDTIRMVVEDQFGCQTELINIMTVFPIPDGIPISVPGTISGSDSIIFWMQTNAPATKFFWTVAGSGSVSFSTDGDSTALVDPGGAASIRNLATLQSSYSPGIATFYVLPKAKICVGEIDTVIVKINPSNVNIFIPEVFTPDNNGKNDTWLIQWRTDVNPNDYMIMLYNRGGGREYLMDGLTDQWNGQDLPDGVYWYVLMLKNGTTVSNGAVTIRRK